MKCVLPKCNNDLPSDRVNRKQIVTCCNDHGHIHSLNRMTRFRAKGRDVLDCGNEWCNRVFIDFGKGDTICSKCRGSKMGRHDLGRNLDMVGLGRSWKDFRSTICRRNNVICSGYSECSDSCMTVKDGAFKYQVNGGADCYYHAEDTVRSVNFRGSMAACVVSHV